MRTPVPKKDVSANIHYHFSPIFKGNNPNVYPQEGNKQTGVNPHNGCDPASKSNKLLTRATTWLVALRTFCWTKGARHKEHKKSWNRKTDPMVTENRSVSAWDQGHWLQRDTRELGGGGDRKVHMSSTPWSILVVREIYPFIKTHQTTTLKYMHFNLCKLYFNKPYFKRKNTQHSV